MENAVLETEGLTPHDFEARPESRLWNSAWSAGRGGRLLVRGVSGSGKTTFARLVSGARLRVSGAVRVCGVDPRALGDREASRFRRGTLSCVFQDLRLVDGLSAAENLELKLSLTGRRFAGSVGPFAEELGVSPRLDARAETLSRGEKQRFALIRALLQDFAVIVLDEFASHLDDGNAKKAAALVEREARARDALVVCLELGDSGLFAWTGRLDA
jgi:ABC-type lipoprotein export system ATPase subunit